MSMTGVTKYRTRKRKFLPLIVLSPYHQVSLGTIGVAPLPCQNQDNRGGCPGAASTAGVVSKVELGRQKLSSLIPYLQVDMGRPSSVLPGKECTKLISAMGASDGLAIPLEPPIPGLVIGIPRMQIDSLSIGLPDFNNRTFHGLAGWAKNPAGQKQHIPCSLSTTVHQEEIRIPVSRFFNRIVGSLLLGWRKLSLLRQADCAEQ